MENARRKKVFADGLRVESSYSCMEEKEEDLKVAEVESCSSYEMAQDLCGRWGILG